MQLAGVDGCHAGWLCAILDMETGLVSARVYPTAAVLVEHVSAAVVAIDIPIGLSTRADRACDRAARKLLGPRASSVFPPPVRATLAEDSYEGACTINVKACGKRLSKQAYAILPKIREVDAVVRTRPYVFYEVHPEVSFCVWNGDAPMKHPKISGFGFLERYRLVERVFGPVADSIRDQIARTDASDDDILDGLAGLWTAKRIHSGCARRVSPVEERDDCGLLMQMFA
jgi:predicted RNase H-like nuclease